MIPGALAVNRARTCRSWMRGLVLLVPALWPGFFTPPTAGGQAPEKAATKTAAPEIAVAKTVVERNVAIPMRDGTILRADVVRPATEGKYPVLVQRTPYGKGLRLREFAEAGYIVVNQDARGRYA